jgi:hypothetical protein
MLRQVPIFRRGFTTQAVQGFTGAVGNTPLVGYVSIQINQLCSMTVIPDQIKGDLRTNGM